MTKAEIQQMFDLYLQAERDLLLGKETSFQGRTLKHENLSEIIKGRKEWEQRLNSVGGNSSLGALVRFTE